MNKDWITAIPKRSDDSLLEMHAMLKHRRTAFESIIAGTEEIIETERTIQNAIEAELKSRGYREV